MCQKNERPAGKGEALGNSLRGPFLNPHTPSPPIDQHPAQPGPVLMRHYFRDGELTGGAHG